MNSIKVATHSETFHADELFAIAILSLALDQDLEIIRTRDEEKMKTAEYVIDVGGVYDPLNKKFDHHQSGGAGKRDNGIPYASCGLLWKHFGTQLCGTGEMATMVEEDFIQTIDAEDNGIESFAKVSEFIHPFTLGRLINSFNPTWKEETANQDEIFKTLIPFAKDIIKREIRRTQDKKEAEDVVREAYHFSPDKRLIILDESYPANDILAEYPEPLYVIKYRKSQGTWGISAVRNDLYSYKNRKDFPKAWGGKKDAELQAITGVPDALFCHTGLFLVVSKTKEGAIALAELALEA